MRRASGFTLIELVVVVALIVIVAGVTVASMFATRRNVGVEQAAFDLATRLQGIRITAIAEQRDHVLVVVGAPGDDSSGCSSVGSDRCVRLFVLRAAEAGWDETWNVKAFDPAAPGVKAELVEVEPLPAGVNLDLAGAGRTGPPPLDGIKLFAPDVVTTCGGRTCLAMRFEASGDFRPEFPGARGETFAGVGLAFTSDLAGKTAAAERRGVVVAIPSAITKHFSYSL